MKHVLDRFGWRRRKAGGKRGGKAGNVRQSVCVDAIVRQISKGVKINELVAKTSRDVALSDVLIGCKVEEQLVFFVHGLRKVS